jgi:hypothetical protein
MSKVLDLLKEKNFYLERFLEESQKERTRFKARRFGNLDSLYNKREQILLNIQSIDRRINTICEEEGEDLLKAPKKEEMNALLKTIKTNVQSIMEEDLEIISFIENEKTKIIQEIGKTKEGRKVLKGYKAL